MVARSRVAKRDFTHTFQFVIPAKSMQGIDIESNRESILRDVVQAAIQGYIPSLHEAIDKWLSSLSSPNED